MLVKKEKTKVMEVLLEQDRPEKFEEPSGASLPETFFRWLIWSISNDDNNVDEILNMSFYLSRKRFPKSSKAHHMSKSGSSYNICHFFFIFS